MGVPTQTDMAVLNEVVRRVLEMDRELDALTQERNDLRRVVEGYRTVLHVAVAQLRDLTLRQMQRDGGQA